MDLRNSNIFKLTLINHFIFASFLAFCLADTYDNEQVHSSADFFKVGVLPYGKLNQIDNRVKDVKNDIKGLKGDIKKLDEKLDKLQKNYEATIQTQNLIYSRLLDQDTKLNQIIQNTKPPKPGGNYIANQRILVGRSISNRDSQDDFLNEFVQAVYNWENKTDSRLTKMMNVISEIYKEDKKLSLDLSKINERQDSDDGTGLFDKVRKEIREQFSINKAELKGDISAVNANCLKIQTQSNNISFLLLALIDDLSTGDAKPKKYNHENSILPADEESSLLASKTMKDSVCDNANKLINSTIEQFRTDLTNARQQILSRIDKENAKINDRLYTLNNNYQHLNNLRNCNTSLVRSVDQSNNNQNEIDSSTYETSPSTISSTFALPPFWQGHLNKGPQSKSRSKSGTRTKLISPIKHEQKNNMKCHIPDIMSPASCEELYQYRANCDGVYVITIQDTPARVYCEMDSDGGSTVLMRRGQFNDVELTKFNRNWKDYKQGFGTIDADFWLGLDKIHELTKNKDQQLIIDLENFNGGQLSLKYNKFYIDNESNNYRLTIGDPDTHTDLTYANVLLQHSGSNFATKDANDSYNCARKFEAGWWFLSSSKCHNVLLNGVFYSNSNSPLLNDGIQWPNWSKRQYLKAVQMKVRSKRN